MTYREMFDSAMKCETPEKAADWLAFESGRHAGRFSTTREEAEKVLRGNLGYMAGYYDHETARKVQRLFGAVHPIFGSADYHQTVSPEQAFKMGQDATAKREG